ncbi:hypothetical protein BBJ28_00009183 [Nothophytophthora sp. Chile5]|nr:hypothetical protein BBJ28_00009183 [Nothophytophthora sp. Chile5]
MESAAPAASAAAPPARESSISFCDEPWTAEAARLLLELDEGAVGFHGDQEWQWRDSTYTRFASECRARRWPVNSRAACVFMLHALRLGAIGMKLSSGSHSADGFAQWSLAEMHEMGALMRRVADGPAVSVSWALQLERFLERMRTKDVSYRLSGRTVDHFTQRASGFLPAKLLPKARTSPTKLVTGEVDPRPSTESTRAEAAKTPEATAKKLKTDATPSAEPLESAMHEEATRGAGSSRAQQEAGDGVVDTGLQVEEPEGGEVEEEHAATRPAKNVRRPRETAAKDREDHKTPTSDSPRRQQQLTATSSRRAATSTRARTPHRQHRQHRSRPADWPTKPWGEFVVELLLAEKTARNEDEADYVRFLRNLYEL